MTEQKRRGVKRWLKVGAGWCLLVVGVAGLFLPVMQGLLCIAGGLTLLSTEYQWAGVCLEWVKRTIRLHKKDGRSQRQSEAAAQLPDGRPLGKNPPREKPQDQAVGATTVWLDGGVQRVPPRPSASAQAGEEGGKARCC
jgi:Putative transmembrane protein (PGPGW)